MNSQLKKLCFFVFDPPGKKFALEYSAKASFGSILRGMPTDFPYTYLLQNVKFYMTKSRFASTSAHSRRPARTKIRMLRGFRSLRKSSERERSRSHLLKHFSNASTSWVREQHLYIRYSPRRGIPSSNPRQVSMFFVFAFLCSTLRLCAHV